MKKEILLASANVHKVREIGQVLAPLGFKVLSLSEAGIRVPAPVEDALSFGENALIKARYYARFYEGWVLSDDSGIEVPQLNWAPGIYSARYAGENASDEDNLQKLISAVKDLGISAAAQYICALCFHKKDGAFFEFEANWRGQILTEKRGKNGFGYDPIFLLPELGLSSAELEPELKNTLSHRGQALKKFCAFLEHFDEP